MQPSRSFLLASTALTLLTACGSGGGGGDAPASAPAPTVAITAGNQTAVARATLSGGLALAGSQTVQSAAASPAAPAAAALEVPATSGTLRGVVAQALAHGMLKRPRAAPGAVKPLAVVSETRNCALSGTVTMTTDDRDNNGVISAGDTESIAFNQCRDSTVSLRNGTTVLTVTGVTSDTETRLELSATLAFQQLAIEQDQAATRIDGTVAVALLETPTLFRLTLTVASGLTVAASGPGYSDSITYDPGMRFAIESSSANPPSVTTRFDGSFSATSLGGRITVATPQPVRRLARDTYPSSGQILVTGSGGSQERITVLSNAQVRIELDADGNGIFETVSIVLWSTLLPA
jgi:hypothetical protein